MQMQTSYTRNVIRDCTVRILDNLDVDKSIISFLQVNCSQATFSFQESFGMVN